jgi:DNA-binding response OmpR family regulator
MHVLVVDDDQPLLAIIEQALEREGFEVACATTIATAMDRSDERAPDVWIIGSWLPDGSGLDLLIALRLLDPDVHVILTGTGSEASRVLGLVSGADDYVSKPFSAREVAARVISLARRRRASSTALLEFGRLVIDRDAREVRVDGRLIDMPKRELDLLLHLATHPRQSFSREQLLRDVWSSSADWQGPATVTEHMRRLRRRIEQDPLDPRWLVTIRGLGYRFEPGFTDQRSLAWSRIAFGRETILL